MQSLLRSTLVRGRAMSALSCSLPHHTSHVRQVSEDFWSSEGEKDEFPRVRIIQLLKSTKRSGYVAVVARGMETFQIMANEHMKIGDTPIYTREEGLIDIRHFDPRPGNTYPLSSIPDGHQVFNLEVKPGGGGKISRGAGTCCTIMRRNDDKVTVKLPSGFLREFDGRCRATLGKVGNEGHSSVKLRKAGEAVNLRRSKSSKKTLSFVTV